MIPQRTSTLAGFHYKGKLQYIIFNMSQYQQQKHYYMKTSFRIKTPLHVYYTTLLKGNFVPVAIVIVVVVAVEFLLEQQR